MTYVINDTTLSAETYVSGRQSTDKWGCNNQVGDNFPYVEQTGQEPTSITFDMNFTGSGRYDMVTSIRADIKDCETILCEFSDKYLYGNQKYVWLAQSSFNIDEAGGKIIKGTLSGLVDTRTIHSCDFDGCWTAGNNGGVPAISEDTMFGKYSLKMTEASSSTRWFRLTPTQNWDLSDYSYICCWIKLSQASSWFSSIPLYLETSSMNHYKWDVDSFAADTWHFQRYDLDNPDSTTGSFDISNVNQFFLAPRAPDATSYSVYIAHVYVE